MEQTSPRWKIIRLIYLYLVSLIGLVVFIIGGVGLVDTGLKVLLNVEESYYGDAKQICRDPYRSGYYGKRVPAPVSVPEISKEEPVVVDVNSQEYKDCVKEEEERQKKQEESNRRRDIAQALSMMILGTPVWLYHWFVIQREHKKQQV